MAERLLIPRLQDESVRLHWSLTEVMALLSNLSVRATPIGASDPGWEPLLHSCTRSQRSLSILLDAVDSVTLSLASVGNGFSDLRLRREDVDLLFCKSEVPETEALIPATAFGISIGIQDNGRFRKLIDAGHTPATRRRNPRTGLENIYMTSADVAAFHRRFVKVPSLAAETGRTIFEIRADLKRAEVPVFAPEGQDFGRLFLREAVEAALSPKVDRRT